MLRTLICPNCGFTKDAIDISNSICNTCGTIMVEEDAYLKISNTKEKTTRKEILKAAEKCVCGDREQDYGSPEDNFARIAKLWSVYLARS